MAFFKKLTSIFIATFYYLALLFVIYMALCQIALVFGRFFIVKIIALLLLLDALHALFIRYRARRWERTVTRDANGILANAASYTLDGATDTAILFVHGFADTPETWQLLAPRLHELTRATCRVMRLPYISTPLRLQHCAKLESWLDTLRDEVAILRKKHKRIFIVGHSLGGGLALLSRDVDGVIVLAPLIRAPRKFGVPLDVVFWLADHFFIFTRVWPNPFPVVGKSKDGRFYVRDHDRFISFSIFRAMFAMTKKCSGSILLPNNQKRELEAPATLAFISTRDNVIDTPFALRWLHGAEIITTDEAGHLLQFDVGWEQRAEQIAAFISRA